MVWGLPSHGVSGTRAVLGGVGHSRIPNSGREWPRCAPQWQGGGGGLWVSHPWYEWQKGVFALGGGVPYSSRV